MFYEQLPIRGDGSRRNVSLPPGNFGTGRPDTPTGSNRSNPIARTPAARRPQERRTSRRPPRPDNVRRMHQSLHHLSPTLHGWMKTFWLKCVPWFCCNARSKDQSSLGFDDTGFPKERQAFRRCRSPILWSGWQTRKLSSSRKPVDRDVECKPSVAYRLYLPKTGPMIQTVWKPPRSPPNPVPNQTSNCSGKIRQAVASEVAPGVVLADAG